MSASISYRKVLRFFLWLGIGAAIIFLLVAAIRSQNNGKCSGVEITIKSSAENGFIKEADIKNTIKKIAGGDVTKQLKGDIDLIRIKDTIAKNTWIKYAEVFFDNKSVLNVNIEERVPLARVFTSSAKSFYLDEEGKKMPVPNEAAARVPVYTNMPEEKSAKKDSVWIADIMALSRYINQDEFWSAQIAQIDFDAENGFELVPTVGSHIIKFGSAEDIDKKFHRLKVFYQQVLAKSGFDKYKILNVQFAGQVVADKLKDRPINKQDVVKNVKKVMSEGTKISNGTAPPVAPVMAKPGEEARTETGEKIVSPNPAAENEKPEPPKAVVKPSNTGN